MAQLRPFRGLRYSSAAGEPATLVAPPYDVLSPEQREEYAAQNPHNAVYITLPESKDDDRTKYVKYMRSASRLAEWRRDGSLELEGQPALYRYTQSFTIPGDPKTHVRTAIVALIKVEGYEKGVVLPHEQTFPKHKEDRLRILEATRAHVECIYGLFEDEGGAVFASIRDAAAQPGFEFKTDDGVGHCFEVIEDEATINAIIEPLRDSKVWIADGHHRYETAVTFRAMQGDKNDLIPEDFMMMALSSISDPGLLILPTHRIVKDIPMTLEQMEDACQRFFTVKRVANMGLLREMNKLSLPDNRVLGVALPGGVGLLLTLDRPKDALAWMEGPGSEELKLLDVSILHNVVFEKVLGLTGHDFFGYTRDPEEALKAVEDGKSASFLMNPPTVDDMRTIALGGEKMPQKSTYYYPKLLSGLVYWSLDDF